MTVNSNVPRRSLDFNDWQSVLSDLDQLTAAEYSMAGKWNLQQCCDHLNDWMGFTMDGYPAAPVHMRVMFFLMRNTVGKSIFKKILRERRMKPGIPTAPDTAHQNKNDDQLSVDNYRSTIERFIDFDGQPHASPVFGAMSLDEANQLHLIHAAHHLSFLTSVEH